MAVDLLAGGRDLRSEILFGRDARSLVIQIQAVDIRSKGRD